MHDKIPAFTSNLKKQKRNLVVVRAGKQSLHNRWLDKPYCDRNWDLLVSYFDEAAFANHVPEEGVQSILIKGGKWDGLYKTFEKFSASKNYDRIWLPDDDIGANTDKLNSIFDESEVYGLSVSQPSLTPNSFFSHFMFVSCAGFRLRYTNYIEIMVPCLTQSLFRKVLPLFEHTMSGFGLDYLWCRFPESGPFKAAIMDSVQVHHTRPVGSQLRKSIRKSKYMTSEDEEIKLCAEFGGVKKAVPVAYAGITSDGFEVTGRLQMALKMRRGYNQALDRFLDPTYAKVKLRQLMKRQLLKSMSLTPVRYRYSIR